MQVKIRQESEADYASIYEINRLAFDRLSEAALVDALRKNKSVFIPELSLVATNKDEIVGHILLTKINIKHSDNVKTASLALGPMAVKPAFQKNGIGAMLINAGLIQARVLQFESVIVLGHPDYYARFGFIPASRYKIKAPFDVPDNAFMALELVPEALKNVQGTVLYPSEFEEV